MSISKKILSTGRNFTFQARNTSTLVKSITIRPTLRPYNELSVISPGRFSIPKKPFDMNVQYIDSSPDEKRKQTVIAIHGRPGNCRHFESMAMTFKDSDVRFVAISLPGFEHTRENGYFWHSIPETTNFVRQFLYDLKIDTIDNLICHSFGVHTTVPLWDNPEDLNIRSLCMYAPQPFWEMKYLEYAKENKKLFLLNNKLWYKLLDLIQVHNLGKTPLKFDNANDMLWFCCVQFDQMLLGFEERFRRVVNNTDTPVSVMYGEREKLIFKENSAKLNSILGMEDEHIVRLDPKIHTEKDVIDNGTRVNSYIILDSGHLLHLTHQQFARQMLVNLLAKVGGR